MTKKNIIISVLLIILGIGIGIGIGIRIGIAKSGINLTSAGKSQALSVNQKLEALQLLGTLATTGASLNSADLKGAVRLHSAVRNKVERNVVKNELVTQLNHAKVLDLAEPLDQASALNLTEQLNHEKLLNSSKLLDLAELLNLTKQLNHEKLLNLSKQLDLAELLSLTKQLDQTKTPLLANELGLAKALNLSKLQRLPHVGAAELLS
jgi:hypothetical protein